jgi:glutamine synthetase
MPPAPLPSDVLPGQANFVLPGQARFVLPGQARFVDAFVIDINGLPRGKRLTAGTWARGAEVSFSASALVLDARGVSQGPLGLGTQDGNPDAAGLPVDGMLQPVPWAREAVAQCLLSMRGADGAPLWYDPREALAGVVARLRADGLHPVVSCELEFYLVGTDARGRPAPRAGAAARAHLDPQAIEAEGEYLHRLLAALNAQDNPTEGMVAEYGPGQFELATPHGPDPVLVADRAALQRRAAVGVAASLGQRASFMAKPFEAQAGSGLHVHASLVDAAGRNLFGAAGGEALLGAAVAGLQRTHAQAMAILAPSFSAYRRYRPGAFAPLGSFWGHDNRSVAFRIPRGPPAARRIEHRVAAADASPHLVMAAILAGMHHGITGRLAPTPPTRGAADDTPDPALPRDIFTALHAMRAGDVLPGYLPPHFAEMFCACKRAEADDLLACVQPVEHDSYL